MKNIFTIILNFLLPQAPNVTKLEALLPEDFRKMGGRPERFAMPDARDIMAVFDYKRPAVRQAVWELKYRGNRKIAKLLAECLYEELVTELSDRKTAENFEKPLLIPAPLSKKRLKERGWNQCELLATALETLDGGNFFEVRRDILVKIKNTESQTKKNRAERLKNLSDCFAVTSGDISGRNIILLDDVTTTGATFEEARQTLFASGAHKILSVAVAH